MSRINSMLDVGKRSLSNSQTALQVVGHNIANKSTENYSRQRVEIEANTPIGAGNKRIGTGAKASKVTRTNNPYLEKEIQKETSDLGYAKGRAQALIRVEEVYNEQSAKGLNKFIGDFFNAFREVASNPENLATRTLVRETAHYLTKDFHRINRQLKSIQADIDQQVGSHVIEINQFTEEIAQLNEKIQSVELTGANANDERDRRDLLLKRLGEKLNIKYTEGRDGQVTVTAGNSLLLVSGYSSMKLSAAKTAAREGKREGNVDIYYHPTEKGTPVRATDQIKGGELGGVVGVRDETINNLLYHLDNMAVSIGREVNKAHSLGFDRYSERGQDFFVDFNQFEDASESIKLNKVIHNDSGRIAAAGKPNAPGDNTIANVIGLLQYKGIMDEGKATVDDYYNSVVGQTGVTVKKARTALESQENILTQLNNIRESISGVSLDEETTKMIEFQKAFDASARLITTADEMFDTVLSLKR